MSLFQTKEWWSTRVSTNEEFDDRHLVTASLDNQNDQEEQIIVGSFAGILRIYAPQKGDYQITNLLFEQDFKEPIIQVQVGQLSPFSNDICLCVLFFKKMIVLSFTKSQIGFQHKVIYQHGLERNAYNMIIGKFGQQNKDFICVQSCDGLLSIYEHDKLSCSAQISNFLLPGPIAYNPVTDSFTVFNNTYELQSYKYSNIAASFHSNKKLQHDWSVNIGEQSLGIQCVERAYRVFDFVVMTEEAMFIISQDGSIRNQKKFEYPCANFKVLDIPEKNGNLVHYTKDQSDNPLKVLTILISSFTHNLMLYEEFQLLWATKTEYIAHALTTGTFGQTRGLITTLNDEGWLQVSYFGTNQPLNIQQLSGSIKNQSYESMDNQYHQILEDIQKKEGSGGSKSRSKSQQPDADAGKDMLNINLQVMGNQICKDYIENKEKYFQTKDGNVLATKLRVSLTFNGIKACNIQVFFNLPDNLVADKNPFFLEELKGSEGGSSTPYSFEILIFSLNDYTPYTTEILAQASFNNFVPGKPINKDPRGAVAKQYIPIGSMCYFSPPIKNSSYKITVQSSQDIPPLNELFEEVTQLNCNNDLEQCLTNPNAFSFLLANGIDCTVLVSKSSNKYRIQSSRFDGIWFILQEMVAKVTAIYKQKGQPLEIKFPDDVPLSDLFNIIDEHYMTRKELQTKKEELEKKAIEFRTIQKRLLTRFKEKNPAPLNNLDILLQKSYEDILNLGNQVEAGQVKLKKVSHILSVTLYLIHYLLKLRFNLSRQTYKLVQDTIPAKIINDEGEIGWEEITNANIVYLLKVALKKDLKGNIQIEKIEDFSKFRKQMTFLFDKLAKGAF